MRGCICPTITNKTNITKNRDSKNLHSCHLVLKEIVLDDKKDRMPV